MNTLIMLALTLPYIGEIGWVNDTTKTCLYKLPTSSQMYFVVLPAALPCPKQVEIRTDEPKPAQETRAASNSF